MPRPAARWIARAQFGHAFQKKLFVNRRSHDDTDEKQSHSDDRGRPGVMAPSSRSRTLGEEIDLDVRDRLAVGVHENDTVNIERGAVLQQLPSRRTVRQARSESARLHLGDVAAAFTGNEIVGAQSERDRLAVGSYGPRAGYLALEDRVSLALEERKGPEFAVYCPNATCAGGDLAIFLSLSGRSVGPSELALAAEAPRLNEQTDRRREKQQQEEERRQVLHESCLSTRPWPNVTRPATRRRPRGGAGVRA
jgi:hypothetical protein